LSFLVSEVVVDPKKILELLAAVAEGTIGPGAALNSFAQLPFSDLGHTRYDTHRELRLGFGEVVYGAGKELTELIDICELAKKDERPLLITRLQAEHMGTLKEHFPRLEIARRAKAARLYLEDSEAKIGTAAIVTAGTSDSVVAEEAQFCAEFFGLEASLIRDVGVAGLHRLVAELPRLQAVDVIIAVAGMEGALPTVLAGLTPAPVIAVPTSVGYGASLGGITAMLGMLVSCAPGLTVVNIDNGFGAALAAAKMVKHLRVRR
jgi:NCAIR mutase (PurE)-related protein